ncbi:ABC transporter ATP-binding protein [Neobacillus massiliamazoniensis]|uniref:ABC transporter-like protein n=1 Tax=Neobacillus massiliamazoniensis TaxID=1499688 RepID=A0A0U1NWD2_9BACI|nr:ABC transporter ATP-binding protein [Neobacillus massiliamazoniensis]CRK82337.1 ABC transporter-like protein [Neobacillus massiliamazoniensis]
MKKPIIEFMNFGFKYRSQAKPTLFDLNLTIYEGEKVLIVGPSGSGKSTIGHCLNGLVPFSYRGDLTGSLKIMGKETKQEGIFVLSKMVGTVLQDPDGQFIGLTVAEDIAFSLENDCVPQSDMIPRVKEVAEMVDMNNYLGHSLHHLSGGQKQRVALGGVMVDDVPLLLFDEPLANLDPATGKHAIELIDWIHKERNKTIVIIEHRLEDVLYRHVDRIIVINDGRIISDQSPAELFASNVLESVSVREPLYLKALKYAGCEITSGMHPEHIESLDINSCRDKLVNWFELTEKVEAKSASSTILQLENIHFSYQADLKILQDVSFSIAEGEMVSIVGKNGAGKSTLTKLICGFERPESGRILIDGRDCLNDTIKERSLKVGLVMQNPNHMISKHMIFDEVALGLAVRGIPEAEIKQRVEETLRICGLLPFRNWPISALSFGQKKRVTIASILVLQPKILILDEPTAGQDFRHYTEIMEFLLDLNKQGVTVIMITHDMHLMLEYTPRAIVFADGKKIADDSAVNTLGNRSIIQQANLKETSLFELAERVGITEPSEFVERFIAHDKVVGRKWQ